MLERLSGRAGRTERSKGGKRDRRKGGTKKRRERARAEKERGEEGHKERGRQGRQERNKERRLKAKKHGKTGKTFGRATKAFAEWLEQLNADGVDPITVEEFEQIAQMRANVFDHETAAKLFAAGMPEQTIRGELAGVPCQSRFDWLCEKRNVIVDLKTCQTLSKFERDFDFFGYARQMAFYALIRAEMTDTNPSVYVVAVEKQAPFACGVWFVTPSTLATASDDVLATLSEFKKCDHLNVWPTRFESLRQI